MWKLGFKTSCFWEKLILYNLWYTLFHFYSFSQNLSSGLWDGFENRPTYQYYRYQKNAQDSLDIDKYWKLFLTLVRVSSIDAKIAKSILSVSKGLKIISISIHIFISISHFDIGIPLPQFTIIFTGFTLRYLQKSLKFLGI